MRNAFVCPKRILTGSGNVRLGRFRAELGGFTLVELIVVITILAILATVGFLSLSGYSDDARTATVKANVRTVYSAILTESTTSGNSPRYYVSHDPAAALSGAFVFVDGKQVALTGGDLGVGDSNYTAGNPRWDRLRMNGDKFKLAFAGPEGIAGMAPDASAAYSTGELAVGAVDVFKVGANGRKRATPFFQVAGVVTGSKTAVVNGNYGPGVGAGSPGLVRDTASAIASAPLTEPRTVAVVTGDDASGRKWSDGTFAKSCLEYVSSPAGKAYAGSTGSGTYWVDPDGAGGGAEFKAYCDMTTDGGGWTLVMTATSGSGVPAGTTGDFNTDRLVSNGFGAKFSDAKINALYTSQFRATSTHPTFATEKLYGALIPGKTYEHTYNWFVTEHMKTGRTYDERGQYSNAQGLWTVTTTDYFVFNHWGDMDVWFNYANITRFLESPCCVTSPPVFLWVK